VKRGAVYNEIDPYAAEWLKRLILFGHIADGDVDTRSIKDVHPDDWKGYAQVHCFAGIGIWSHALRQAGWPDDRPVWTGSCPCQPFSAAGQQKGFDDDRHLWPEWFRLIGEHRPATVLGEQVASPDALKWLDAVSADMEGADYAIGAADLCAAGVGAPHIRQRLFFVALADGGHTGAERQQRSREHRQQPKDGRACVVALAQGKQRDGDGDEGRRRSEPADGSGMEYAARQQEGLSRRTREPGGTGGGVAHHHHQGREGRLSGRQDTERQDQHGCSGRDGATGGLQHPQSDGREQRRTEPEWRRTAGVWREADWIWCRDGKYRPVEPSTFPLAHGYPSRVGRLRAYGNAICAPVAETFIRAVMSL